MGVSVSSRVRAATLPRAQITRGWMAANCRLRNGRHWRISSGAGFRLFRGPAFDNIADIDRLPGQPHGSDDFGQQLSGRSHKGLTASVFIESRSFAHEYHLRVRAALTKHDMGPRFTQPASGAVAQVGADVCQGFPINRCTLTWQPQLIQDLQARLAAVKTGAPALFKITQRVANVPDDLDMAR